MLRRLLIVLALTVYPAAAWGQSLEDYDYENLAFQGIGVEVGQIWPAGIRGTFTLGIRGDLGLLGPSVRVVPSLVYWSSSLEQDDLPELGEIDVSDLVLNLDGHYFWDLGGVAPYVGAGAALHLLNGEGEAIDDTFVEGLLDAISPGINVLAGTDVQLAGPLRVFGEARAVLLPSQVRSLGVAIGAVWTFPAVPASGRRTSPEDAG